MVCLSIVLSMVLVGARENTEMQILNVLGLEGLNGDIHSLNRNILASLVANKETTIANAVFIKKDFTILTSFVEMVSEMYETTSKNVDFTASSTLIEINDWVNKNTKGNIPTLADQLDPFTVMILLNAVHFKSNWAYQFAPSDTKVDKFFLKKNDFINVDMMYQSGNFRYAINKAADCKIIELPYENNKTSMLIFLPIKRGGLQKVERALNSLFLEKSLEDLQYKRRIEVWLPSFKMEKTYDNFTTILSIMGMDDLFIPTCANLKGIREENDLHVNEVIHKSFIEVNEEGTEAAAVSAAFGYATCYKPPEVIHFRADHPFLFCILDVSSKQVLFLGCLKEPSSKTNSLQF